VCDLFGTLVEAEKRFLVASQESVKDVQGIADDLDVVLVQESQALQTTVTTLLVGLTAVLLVLGCLLANDMQRLRMVLMVRAAWAKLYRSFHQNRIYNADSDTRLGMGDARCDDHDAEAPLIFPLMFCRLFQSKSCDRVFESCAIGFLITFILGILINAACLHIFAVPSLIKSGFAFEQFESAMEFLASQVSPRLILFEAFAYTSYGLFGLQCNKTEHAFFGLTSPELFVDKITTQLKTFDAVHQVWSLETDDFPELKQGLQALRETGLPFVDTFRDRIAPLVLAGNFSEALFLARTQLSDQYDQHESVSSEVSLLIDLIYSNTISLSIFGRDTSLWFIYGISTMLVAAVAFISSLLLRDASVYKLELSDVALDASSALHSLIPKLRLVHDKQQSVMSQRSMSAVFALVISIQVLGIALPIRYLGSLAQQSPILNQVGRLDVLFVRDIYAARELCVHDDLTSIFMVGALCVCVCGWVGVCVCVCVCMCVCV
jgi:hypothetical protein